MKIQLNALQKMFVIPNEMCLKCGVNIHKIGMLQKREKRKT